MGGIEETADVAQVGAPERLDRRVHTLVLLEHVAHAPVERRRERRGGLRGRLAQAGEAQDLRRPLALGAPVLIARAGGQGVTLARRHGHQPPLPEVQEHAPHIERPEIDPQRVPLLAQQ